MASEEDRTLEEQLESQLNDQRESLTAIKDALLSDPSHPELLSVHEELLQVIKGAEEGLFHLKRERLLKEADCYLGGYDHATEEVKVEPLDTAGGLEPESLEEESLSVGSKCRFRHTDGRWYNGQIIGLNGSDTVKLSFLTPTSDNMLMCKFFLQQRCRFGSTCRSSHGFDVQLSSLKPYVSTKWEQSMVGSTIWAISDGRFGIWREAELESWDDELKVGQVVFLDDGKSAKVGAGEMTLTEHAQISDEEEDDSSLSESDSSDLDEESPQGLGFLKSSTLQRGIQTETTVFATWENHTRGIASKMMANMGYRKGMGLGLSGQGMLDPILVKALRSKQSLDHALESQKKEDGKEENHRKKRSRGGKRKREKKIAAVIRAAKDKEEPRPDVFSLINEQLSKHDKAVNGVSGKKQQTKSVMEENKVDRRSLVAYEAEVKELKVQIVKLEDMMKRNKKEKVVYEAALRKLNETRVALAEAEATHASASSAVVGREKEKKWLKF